MSDRPKVAYWVNRLDFQGRFYIDKKFKLFLDKKMPKMSDFGLLMNLDHIMK